VHSNRRKDFARRKDKMGMAGFSRHKDLRRKDKMGTADSNRRQVDRVGWAVVECSIPDSPGL
jgi:hypothetical protein